MDSVRKARARLAAYPKMMATCAGESGAYAACVARAMGEVKRDECKAEFDALKKCMAAAAKKAGAKL